MKFLLKYLRAYRLQSFLAPLFKMLEALFDLFVPLVVARMIDVGIGGHDSAVIWQCFGMLILMALVGLACSFTAQYFAARSAIGAATHMRHDLFAYIQSLGFSEMDTIGASTLITRMTSDINQVQNGINLFLRLFLRSPFVVFGALIMAFTLSPRIAIVFAAVIAVLFAIVIFIMRSTRPRYRDNQGRLDRLTQKTREQLEGVRVIRAFGMEEREAGVFHDVNQDYTHAQIAVGRISSLMNPLTYVAVNLGIVLILYLGAKQVDGNVLLSGHVIALVNYMNQILVELVKLANLVVTLTRAMASVGRIRTVMDTETSMKFPEVSSASWTPSEDAVVFSHVDMRYASSGGESLTDISFRVRTGETVGIIGSTGSGKTTLVQLIPRFYDASAGTVTLMGQPISSWSREDLRRHIAIVMQRPQLFSGTIRENVTWGRPDASDEEIWQALDMAQATDMVRGKKNGLDEMLEQGGRNLSGGQKQRLTIARALIARPDILILDDSSSALDYATDAALRRALRELKNTTLFIVSQRTSSIRHCHHILVLDEGHLVGDATHEELLASCPVYREIHESQFQKGDARA